jgi:hypothetical protein
MYLVDTNVISALWRPKSVPPKAEDDGAILGKGAGQKTRRALERKLASGRMNRMKAANPPAGAVLPLAAAAIKPAGSAKCGTSRSSVATACARSLKDGMRPFE